MIERHTIDFARVSFNVISDPDRGTITLQFDQAGAGRGFRSRDPTSHSPTVWRRGLSRLRSLEHRRTRVHSCCPERGHPHPDYPDVLCFEMQRQAWLASTEAALATFLGFLRATAGIPADVWLAARSGSGMSLAQTDRSTQATPQRSPENTLRRVFQQVRVEQKEGPQTSRKKSSRPVG